MRILESAWKRMEDAHNSGEREAISAANQRVLEAFEGRPIMDTSAWYKEQYDKSGVKGGVKLPETKGDKRETTYKIDAEIQARINRIAKMYADSIDMPHQRCARDDSLTR